LRLPAGEAIRVSVFASGMERGARSISEAFDDYSSHFAFFFCSPLDRNGVIIFTKREY
jgi:hypothetical protein